MEHILFWYRKYTLDLVKKVHIHCTYIALQSHSGPKILNFTKGSTKLQIVFRSSQNPFVMLAT